MSKQLSDAPVRPDEPVTSSSSSTTGSLAVLRPRQWSIGFWQWFGGLLVVGLVIVGVVTFSVWNWLNTIQSGMGTNQNSSAISSLHVGRSAIYADLTFTWNDVQYTTFFNDDPIHAGPATARVTLSVNNPTPNTVVIAYYDDVRLVIPGHQPVVPTNLNLAAAPAKGATQTGWIDFPVAKGIDLHSLKLQLGNAGANEMLVTIPITGSYNPTQYQARTVHPALTVNYYFQGWQVPAYTLTYHLVGIDVRYSYNGTETKAGQQYYTLHFTVDNPNGATVSPGYGFDYLRLALNGGNRPPVDNTLPASFKPNAQGTAGSVTFQAPAGLHSLTIVFLRQAVAGGDPYPVSW
jgi:hypothetical protein